MKYLKQVPWLALFWTLMLLSGFIWNYIWQSANDYNMKVPDGFDFNMLITASQFYYLGFIPLLACGIVYLNVRLNGFSPLFILLMPLIHYWNNFSSIWERYQVIINRDQSITYSQPFFLDILYFYGSLSFLVLVMLGAGLLAQHHRRKNAQKAMDFSPS